MLSDHDDIDDDRKGDTAGMVAYLFFFYSDKKRIASAMSRSYLFHNEKSVSIVNSFCFVVSVIILAFVLPLLYTHVAHQS